MTIKATSQKISFDVPADYIGKEIEVIAFVADKQPPFTDSIDNPLTHIASEKGLAKDWLTAEENNAWRDL